MRRAASCPRYECRVDLEGCMRPFQPCPLHCSALHTLPGVVDQQSGTFSLAKNPPGTSGSTTQGQAGGDERRIPSSALGGKKHHVITGCHRHGQPLHSHFAFAFAFAPDGAAQSRNQGLRPLSITIHESMSLGKKSPAIDRGGETLASSAPKCCAPRE